MAKEGRKGKHFSKTIVYLSMTPERLLEEKLAGGQATGNSGKNSKKRRRGRTERQ